MVFAEVLTGEVLTVLPELQASASRGKIMKRKCSFMVTPRITQRRFTPLDFET